MQPTVYRKPSRASNPEDGLAILRGSLLTNLDVLIELINGSDRAKSREAAAALPPVARATAGTKVVSVQESKPFLRRPSVLFAQVVPAPSAGAASHQSGGLSTTVLRWWDESIEEVWAIGARRTLHRDDGPAVVRSGGGEEWWLEGKRHRADGPAVSVRDRREWWNNGHLHREDGPAKVAASVEGVSAQWHRGGVSNASRRFEGQRYEELASPLVRRLVARGDVSNLVPLEHVRRDLLVIPEMQRELLDLLADLDEGESAR